MGHIGCLANHWSVPVVTSWGFHPISLLYQINLASLLTCHFWCKISIEKPSKTLKRVKSPLHNPCSLGDLWKHPLIYDFTAKVQLVKNTSKMCKIAEPIGTGNFWSNPRYNWVLGCSILLSFQELSESHNLILTGCDLDPWFFSIQVTSCAKIVISDQQKLELFHVNILNAQTPNWGKSVAFTINHPRFIWRPGGCSIVNASNSHQFGSEHLHCHWNRDWLKCEKTIKIFQFGQLITLHNLSRRSDCNLQQNHLCCSPFPHLVNVVLTQVQSMLLSHTSLISCLCDFDFILWKGSYLISENTLFPWTFRLYM